MNVRPIETSYNGYRLRSRLEARWAVYFDAVGIKWMYEHEGFYLPDWSMYLPDFYLPELDCYAEVKPKLFSREEFSRCMHLPRPCILLDGVPDNRGYFAVGSSLDAGYQDYLSANDYQFVLLQVSHDKKRLWFLLGEHPEDYFLYNWPIEAARSARFEHGENPSGIYNAN